MRSDFIMVYIFSLPLSSSSFSSFSHCSFPIFPKGNNTYYYHQSCSLADEPFWSLRAILFSTVAGMRTGSNVVSDKLVLSIIFVEITLLQPTLVHYRISQFASYQFLWFSVWILRICRWSTFPPFLLLLSPEEFNPVIAPYRSHTMCVIAGWLYLGKAYSLALFLLHSPFLASHG